MSHGQAAVERGFNINNSDLKINVSPEGVIAKRLVEDHLLANNLPHTIQITGSMLRVFNALMQNVPKWWDTVKILEHLLQDF